MDWFKPNVQWPYVHYLQRQLYCFYFLHQKKKKKDNLGDEQGQNL